MPFSALEIQDYTNWLNQINIPGVWTIKHLTAMGTQVEWRDGAFELHNFFRIDR
jgi:hypothetical protein